VIRAEFGRVNGTILRFGVEAQQDPLADSPINPYIDLNTGASASTPEAHRNFQAGRVPAFFMPAHQEPKCLN